MSETHREASAARAAAGAVLAVRASDRTGILVTGKDRTSWLNGLVTCDLAKLGAADGAYGLIVEKKGRIQTDFFAVPGRSRDGAGEAIALGVPRDLGQAILETLDHYLIMEDAELERVDLAFWFLLGPKAAAIASELPAPYAGALALFGLEGAVVAAPSADAEALAGRIAERVTEAGGIVTDEATWDAVRIERGVPRFGVEVDATLYPQEASLEKLAVSFDKGCYLGQEVVYMLENRGHVKRKLVALEADGDAPLGKGDPVTTPEGALVGDVKSSVVGPAAGKPVAIAMVKWAQTKPGTELRVGDRVARVRA
ncbi:MAG: folate-binding protein YgfZ [Labilithrix sp.]|nr:folate-binding protein YgfZ [Labilithrix sp.]